MTTVFLQRGVYQEPMYEGEFTKLSASETLFKVRHLDVNPDRPGHSALIEVYWSKRDLVPYEDHTIGEGSSLTMEMSGSLYEFYHAPVAERK